MRSAADNEAIFPPKLGLDLFRAFAKQSAQSSHFILRNNLGLTRREQQLVQRIGCGLTNKEIAGEFGLSEQTVKNHVHRMLRKLGATDRRNMVELCCMPGAVA